MRRCAQTQTLALNQLCSRSAIYMIVDRPVKGSTDPGHEGAWCTWQGYGHRGHASHIEKVGFLAHDYRVISCGGHDSATYQWRIRGPSKPCATLTTRRSTSVAFCLPLTCPNIMPCRSPVCRWLVAALLPLSIRVHRRVCGQAAAAERAGAGRVAQGG